MGPTAACRVPREMAAALLQRALTRHRAVRLTLTGPAQTGGHPELVGDVVLLQSDSDVDELAPADRVTVVLNVNGRRTPPIALERIRSAQLV